MINPNKRLFPCRIDELPIIGGYIQISLVRDVADFLPYKKYATPYPGDYLAEKLLVEEAIAPVIYINQMKVVTLNILNGCYGLRPLLNSAEIFFNSAGSLLDVLPKDMGQSQVRKQVNRDDTPGVLLALKNLNQNIANNSLVLIDAGMTLIMQEALVTAAATIKTNNDLRNSLMSTRNAATDGNMILFNNFWSVYVSPTRTTGALIFKTSNAAKYKDYVVAQMMARMRHDEAQTQVHGRITDALGNPVNKAKVKLIPVAGGRTRTVYTDAEGNYVVSGMVATAYNQVVTKGSLVKIVGVDVVTRVHLEVNTVLS